MKNFIKSDFNSSMHQLGSSGDYQVVFIWKKKNGKKIVIWDNKCFSL